MVRLADLRASSRRTAPTRSDLALLRGPRRGRSLARPRLDRVGGSLHRRDDSHRCGTVCRSCGRRLPTPSGACGHTRYRRRARAPAASIAVDRAPFLAFRSADEGHVARHHRGLPGASRTEQQTCRASSLTRSFGNRRDLLLACERCRNGRPLRNPPHVAG